MREGERGQAGIAGKEFGDIVIEIGEAALDYHGAQIWMLDRRQHCGNRAERVAQDSQVIHIDIAALAQILDGRRHIVSLANAIRDLATLALAMPGKIEEQCAIAAARMEPRNLWQPLARVVVDAVAANERAAIGGGQIPGRERAA